MTDILYSMCSIDFQNYDFYDYFNIFCVAGRGGEMVKIDFRKVKRDFKEWSKTLSNFSCLSSS